MSNLNTHHSSNTSTFIQFLGVFLRLAGIYIIGFAILSLIFKFLIGIDIQDIDGILNSDIDKDKKQNILLLLQTIAPLIQFIILPVLYVIFLKPSILEVFKVNTYKPGLFLMMGIFLYFTFLPVLQYLIQWNQSWNLPEAWSEIEKQMFDMEQRAKALTTLLIQYDSKTEFLIVLCVVAVIPAIGEELFFRGLMQGELSQVLRNPHLAIWITSFAFSFMHFQFFGFVPRLLLGLVFGYLFFWSGNILIPMTLHFLNNGATLVFMNVYKDKFEEMEKQSTESIPVIGVLFSLALTGVLIYYCHRFYRERISVHES